MRLLGERAMTKRALILAVILVFGVGLVGAKVAPTTLAKLIRFSDSIALGTVTDVRAIDGIHVARVKVSQTLKGKESDEFYFLADPTWTCDITTANGGETALFFLVPYQFGPSEFRDLMGFKEPRDFQQALKAATGQTSLFELAWSGRGRMPLRDVEGVQYVTLWTGDVRLPPGIPTIGGPEAKYASFIRSARLNDMLQALRKQLGSTP
jgi:hypothetical protein